MVIYTFHIPGRQQIRLLPQGVRARGARVYRRARLMSAVPRRARAAARPVRPARPGAAGPGGPGRTGGPRLNASLRASLVTWSERRWRLTIRVEVLEFDRIHSRNLINIIILKDGQRGFIGL